MDNDQLIFILLTFSYMWSILECRKISFEKRGDGNFGTLVGVMFGIFGWLIMKYLVKEQ